MTVITAPLGHDVQAGLSAFKEPFVSDPSNNILLLGGANPLQLHDRGIANGKPTKYWFTFLGPPQPTRQRTIVAGGCGAGASACGGSAGLSAVLQEDRLLYWTRSYQVRCYGETFAVAEANALAIKAEIDAARSYKLGCGDGHAVWLVRQLYDQALPTVWTVLTGDWIPIEEETYGIPIFTVRIDLLCMEGAEFLDAGGFPQIGVTSPTVVVAPTFPTPTLTGVL
jgi:hypothetical protein